MSSQSASERRKIGVEIEFAGVDVEDVAEVTAAMFDGSIRKSHDLEYYVDTSLGEFRVELDSKPLKDLAEHLAAKPNSNSFTLARLGFETIRSAASTLVPYEIVTPPLPESELSTVDALVDELRKRGATGTQDGLLYAFGVHFNPELRDLSATVIHAHLQAFFMLRPWIKEAFETDLSRQVMPYIRPHGDEYVALVLGQEAPNIEQLVDEYVLHNPTRNRDLDMLPMLTYLCEERVRKVVGDNEKINTRPTFHYRLPNANVGDPNWSVSDEWKSWQAVERLANDPSLLGLGRREWNKRYGQSKSVDEQSWIPFVEENLI